MAILGLSADGVASTDASMGKEELSDGRDNIIEAEQRTLLLGHLVMFGCSTETEPSTNRDMAGGKDKKQQ